MTLRSVCEPIRAVIENSWTTDAKFIRADARAIDAAKKTVSLKTGDGDANLELPYDKLVIAVGAQPNTFGIPGVQENALFPKEVEDRFRIVLAEAMPRVLGPFDPQLADLARTHLETRGVEVREKCAVTGVTADAVTYQPSLPRSATAEQK